MQILSWLFLGACLISPARAEVGPAGILGAPQPVESSSALRLSSGNAELLRLSAALDRPNGLDALFDGSSLRRSLSVGDPVAADFRRELVVRNGELDRFRLTYVPWDLRVEAGYLGLGSSRNDLVSLSPYLNLRQHSESLPTDWVDYRLRLQLGFVDMAARYFNDVPQADPELEALLSRLGSLGDAGSGDVSRQTRYNDSYQTTRLLIGSVLAQAGRAYELYGPVDIGWTLSGLLKVTHLFPNLALDAAAGPRVDLGDGRSVGLFGGVTENLSPVGNRLLQGIFAGDTGLSWQWEAAPHATAVYAGPLPGWEEMHLETSASRQWNADTTADQVRAGLWTIMGGKPTELYGMWRRESGPGIEFERERCEAGLSCRFSDTVTGNLGYQTEKIRYGDANIERQSLIGNLSIMLDDGKQKLTVEQRSGAKDALTSKQVEGFGKVAFALNAAVSEAIGVAETAELLVELMRLPLTGNADQVYQRLQDLSRAIRGMSPETKQAFLATLLASETSPESRELIKGLFEGDSLDQLANDLDKVKGLKDLQDRLGSADLKPLLARLEGMRSLLAMISSDGVMERLAVRMGRSWLLDYLGKVDEPIQGLDMRFRWSPAVMLAAGQILSSRPSPLAPITAVDARDKIEPWLWRGLAKNLGMDPSSSPERITEALLSNAAQAVKQELRRNLGGGFFNGLSGKTGPEAAREIVDSLPASLQTSLRARYGQDLAGLTSGLSSQQAVERIFDAVVDQAIKDKLGPIAKQGTAALASWLGGLIRKEINAMMIQVLLASEQLDRLTVDGGRKPSDLGVQMLGDSFKKLDQRRGRMKRIFKESSALLESYP